MHHIFSKHTHVGIDIDETLAATVSGLIDYAHSIGELSHISSIDDIRKHDASGLRSDMTAEESMYLWEGYGKSTLAPDSVSPVTGSLEGVKKLHHLGKELYIITARSNKESWKVDRTLAWVRVHLPYITADRIHFVNHFSTDALPKSHVCQQLGVTLMIDDALENAYELCSAGISCILLEKPWNRDIVYTHPLLYRVSGWEEINQYLN